MLSEKTDDKATRISAATAITMASRPMRPRKYPRRQIAKLAAPVREPLQTTNSAMIPIDAAASHFNGDLARLVAKR